MKSIRTNIVLSVIVAVFAAVPALAQSQTMTDAHVARIKQSCGLALSTLGRIHEDDAPVYINRNQTYFSISDKMMATLNSRLALNHYDASDLVKTASDFNKALNDFRTAYKTYDDTMRTLVHIDCQQVPVTFYDTATAAREQRDAVHQTVVRLQQLIDQYRQNVANFKAKNFPGQSGGSNG